MRSFCLAVLVAASTLFFAFDSAEARVRLVARVDLSAQTVTVSYDGRVIDRWPVSTGRKGHRTPTGTWRPVRMYKMWHSRKYDWTPMPHSIFFYRGYAIHGTGAVGQLGRPASHGCVRLHPDHARKLFRLVKEVGPRSTRVVVQN